MWRGRGSNLGRVIPPAPVSLSLFVIVGLDKHHPWPSRLTKAVPTIGGVMVKASVSSAGRSWFKSRPDHTPHPLSLFVSVSVCLSAVCLSLSHCLFFSVSLCFCFSLPPPSLSFTLSVSVCLSVSLSLSLLPVSAELVLLQLPDPRMALWGQRLYRLARY